MKKSTIIRGTNEDVQAEYLMLTESLLKNLSSTDKHILLIATVHEFVKSVEEDN